MNKLVIRDMEEKDLLVQDAYFKNAPVDFLLQLGLNPTMARAHKPDLTALRRRLETPLENRDVHAFVFEYNGETAGTMVLKQIQFGNSCDAHGHIFNPELRRQSLGTQALVTGFELAFKIFQLNLIFCEPSVDNAAPNRLLRSVGLQVVDTYDVPAGGILLPRRANRYEIHRDWFFNKLRPNFP